MYSQPQPQPTGRVDCILDGDMATGSCVLDKSLSVKDQNVFFPSFIVGDVVFDMVLTNGKTSAKLYGTKTDPKKTKFMGSSIYLKLNFSTKDAEIFHDQVSFATYGSVLDFKFQDIMDILSNSEIFCSFVFIFNRVLIYTPESPIDFPENDVPITFDDQSSFSFTQTIHEMEIPKNLVFQTFIVSENHFCFYLDVNTKNNHVYIGMVKKNTTKDKIDVCLEASSQPIKLFNKKDIKFSFASGKNSAVIDTKLFWSDFEKVFQQKNTISITYSSLKILMPDSNKFPTSKRSPLSEQSYTLTSTHFTQKVTFPKVDFKLTNQAKVAKGFVGLQNQGATCYMNSALQALYHLPSFRRLVFSMETTGEEDITTSIPLALQRLFAQMQYLETSVSTKDLTRSFGWGSAQTMMQHDIQEFLRVLIDNLEKKLKICNLDQDLRSLFVGKTRSFIRGVGVDYSNEKLEEFYDLTMRIHGCDDLYQSFNQYISTELLTGKNQYKTDEFGLVDVSMGVEFSVFPSVLYIHLNRFEYNPNTGNMSKINDRFAFPPELNLSNYLAKEADRSISPLYELTGVLVHSGSLAGGHYYTFLRTSTDPQWIKFNDSTVTLATEEEAIEDNFGGISNAGMPKSFSAYMLIYIRKSEMDEIMSKVTDDQVPQHLKDYIFNIKSAPAKNAYESSKQTIEVSFLTIDDLSLDSAESLVSKNPEKKFELSKSVTNNALYELAAKEYNLTIGQFRLFKFDYYKKPSSFVPPTKDIFSKMSYITGCILLFVQKLNDGEAFAFPDGSMFIFAKYFDFYKQSLSFVSIMNTKSDLTTESLISSFIEIAHLPKETKLIAYSPNTFNKQPKVLINSATLPNQYITSGSTIVFATEITSAFEKKEINYKPVNGLINLSLSSSNFTFPEWYTNALSDFAQLDVFLVSQQEEKQFSFKMLKDGTFSELKYHISKAAHLNYDENHSAIVLYKPFNSKSPNKTPIDTKAIPTLNSFFNYHPSTFGLTDYRIYYDYLEGISELSLANMNLISVQYSSDGVKIDYNDELVMPRGSTFQQVLEAANQKGANIEPSQVIIVIMNKDHSFYTLHSKFNEVVTPYFSIRFNKVTECMRNCTNDDIALVFERGNKQSSCYQKFVPTQPLTITKIRRDETLADIRARLEATFPDLVGGYYFVPSLLGGKVPTDRSVISHFLEETKSYVLRYIYNKPEKEAKPKKVARSQSVQIYN